jgi:hypothetical protein
MYILKYFLEFMKYGSDLFSRKDDMENLHNSTNQNINDVIYLLTFAVFSYSKSKQNFSWQII